MGQDRQKVERARGVKPRSTEIPVVCMYTAQRSIHGQQGASMADRNECQEGPGNPIFLVITVEREGRGRKEGAGWLASWLVGLGEEPGEPANTTLCCPCPSPLRLARPYSWSLGLPECSSGSIWTGHGSIPDPFHLAPLPWRWRADGRATRPSLLVRAVQLS